MSNVFDQNETHEPQLEDKDYFVELVGEDKKFKTPQDLAKGKALADRHIENLNRTLASLRDELKSRSTVDDLMTKIEQRQQQPNVQTQGEHQSPPEKSAEGGLTAQDVERILAEREAARTKEANLNKAVNKLTEMFGDEAPAQIAAKARELGVTTEYLKEQARIAPSLVTELFTPKPAQQRDVFSPAAPANRVNSGGLVGGKAGTEKYSDFDKVRKTDREKFYSPAFQRTIDEAVMRAQAQGRFDEFMNS